MKASNLFLLSVSLILGLAAAEIVCRIFVKVPRAYQVKPIAVFENDEELQWRLKKVFRYGNVTIGADGLRNTLPIDNSADSFNILAIGDSHTFGFGVADNAAYPAQLSLMLKKAYPDRSINVLNGGVPGYNTEQSIGYYRRIKKDYNIDLVLLGIVIDDLLPRYSQVANDQGYLVNTEAKVIADSKKDTHLNQSIKFINRTLKKYSYLVRFFTSKFPGLLTNIQIRMRLKKSSLDYYLSNWSDKELLGRELDFIKEFNREISKDGGSLIMLVFTDPNQMIFNYGFDKYQKPLLLFAKEQNIPIVDLTSAYRPVYKREGYSALFIYNDGHPNENGHKVIAEYVSSFIMNKNLIK